MRFILILLVALSLTMAWQTSAMAGSDDIATSALAETPVHLLSMDATSY